MRRAAMTILALSWLLSAAANAQSNRDAQDSPPAEPVVSERDDAQLTRAERREQRRAERAAEAEVAASAERADEQDDDEGIICRRENVLGTHRRIRVCTTREQREAMRESSREVIRDVTRSRGDLGPEGQ